MEGIFPILSQDEWRVFNRAVTKDEVWSALFDMSLFKALGPDGLHAAFYQHMWDVIGDNMFDLVKNSIEMGILLVGLNDTLLALIPKVSSPKTIRQFRPISLCNVSYKVITKTITNRLKRILPNLVGPFQSSFVSERQISR